MEHLPIQAVIPNVIQALRSQKNIVLTAPTGSGKSTQVAQAIHDSNLVRGVTIIIQPRRVACRALARRVAEERHVHIGSEVGYIVKYDTERSSETKILFVTDGVLIRFLERDPDLSWAGAVIFDEFHERRALGDIALSMLKKAKQRRSSLAIIVMSATIDVANVTSYLDATIVTGKGRLHPVDIYHMPTVDFDYIPSTIAQRIADRHQTGRSGHILAFLPGKEEIEQTTQALADMHLPGLCILPLHGELRGEDQDRVFEPCEERKVIIATNIAETSVTIPGVTFVIDSGYERRMEFDTEHGLNRLGLRRISQASAQQRAGRAGRELPGECIRLWSEEDHKQLIPCAPVEMQVTDLCSIVLTLKSIGVNDVSAFDYLDAPDINHLRVGEIFLKKLGALDADGILTPIGWRMLRLPLSPRYARMVVEAERGGCVNDVAIIAALMAGKPVFKATTSANKKAITKVKLGFAIDDSSDFFLLLEMFRQAKENHWSQEWCEKHFINRDALQEARRLRTNIIRAVNRRGSPQRSYGEERRAAIRRSLIAGLIDRIAIRTGVRSFSFGNDVSIRVDSSSLTDAQLLAFGEIRSIEAHDKRKQVSVIVSLAVRAEQRVLMQIAPHLVLKRRVPLSFDRASACITLREDILLEEVLLDSEERQADLSETLEVLKEQRERALQHGWKVVNVLPGIRMRGTVPWAGKRITVYAERTGPHWATIKEGETPVIVLQEPIVDIPELERKGLPVTLQRRVEGLSATIAQLTTERH